MQAGFFATVLAMVLAVPIGMIAGYYRGWVDTVIARVTDVLLSFPFIILAVGLAAILGPSLTNATIALGVSAVPGLVRIARGETLALREEDFVPAAIANGANDLTIIFRHILPNMTSTLLVQATVTIPAQSSARRCCRSSASACSRRRRPGGRCCRTLSRIWRKRRGSPFSRGSRSSFAALAFNVLGDGLRDVLDPRTTR